MKQVKKDKMEFLFNKIDIFYKCSNEFFIKNLKNANYDLIQTPFIM
jgi:hypothetical protein